MSDPIHIHAPVESIGAPQVNGRGHLVIAWRARLTEAQARACLTTMTDDDPLGVDVVVNGSLVGQAKDVHDFGEGWTLDGMLALGRREEIP